MYSDPECDSRKDIVDVKFYSQFISLRFGAPVPVDPPISIHVISSLPSPPHLHLPFNDSSTVSRLGWVALSDSFTNLMPQAPPMVSQMDHKRVSTPNSPPLQGGALLIAYYTHCRTLVLRVCDTTIKIIRSLLSWCACWYIVPTQPSAALGAVVISDFLRGVNCVWSLSISSHPPGGDLSCSWLNLDQF